MLTTTKTLLLFSAIYSCLGQNHFMTAVKNLNDSKNETKDADNALKNDFMKYVKECASDEDSSEYDDLSDEKQNKGRGNGGTYPEFYGDSKLKNNRQGDNSHQHRNYTRNDHRKNEGFNNKGIDRERTGEQNNNWRNRNSENPSYNYDYRSTQSPYGYDRSLNSGNFEDFRDRMGNPTYPNNQPMNGYVRTSNDEFYGAAPRQYGNMDEIYRRMKRSDDANCINQCAFGYLDVLDDNRVPSETAIIKFLQDHVPNDRKRIQYLRETRRCFAQLATTDNEDGCGFSKMLAKCLKLETE